MKSRFLEVLKVERKLLGNAWRRLSRAVPKNGSPSLLQDGFTLTELLIVISIIAIIGTFAVSQVMGKFNKAKIDSTRIQIKNLGNILDQFRIDCGFYPTTDQGLDALLRKPSGGRECKNYDPEGYMKAKVVPKDGWNNEFQYESDGNKYIIRSLGGDNREGGEGNDADLSSEDAV